MEESSQAKPSLPSTGVMGDLTDAIRDQLAAAGEFVDLPEGSYLAVEGRNPDTLFFILEGSVSVRCHSHGDTIDLAKLGAGETVGEMAAIDPHISRSTVRTNEPTRVWQIPLEKFKVFISEDATAGLMIMTALAKELCQRIHGDSERAAHLVDEAHSASYDADI